MLLDKHSNPYKVYVAYNYQQYTAHNHTRYLYELCTFSTAGGVLFAVAVRVVFTGKVHSRDVHGTTGTSIKVPYPIVSYICIRLCTMLYAYTRLGE